MFIRESKRGAAIIDNRRNLNSVHCVHYRKACLFTWTEQLQEVCKINCRNVFLKTLPHIFNALHFYRNHLHVLNMLSALQALLKAVGQKVVKNHLIQINYTVSL
jgi:hypothetical protein